MPHPLLDLWSTILGLPNLGVYLWIGWACYLLGLGGWIILQKREPAATLSWLISLAALPYIGFVIYYFLGPQRIQRQRLRRIRARAVLPPQPPDLHPTPDAIELARDGIIVDRFSRFGVFGLRKIGHGLSRWQILHRIDGLALVAQADDPSRRRIDQPSLGLEPRRL